MVKQPTNLSLVGSWCSTKSSRAKSSACASTLGNGIRTCKPFCKPCKQRVELNTYFAPFYAIASLVNTRSPQLRTLSRPHSNPSIGEIMRSTSSQLATIFKPDEGQTLKFLGNIITYKFDPNDRGWRFFEFLMTGDSPVPLHRHPWDEVSYLLEGEVELQIEDQLVQATPGYFINLPAGAAHAFTLRSSQAKFLVGVSNAIAAQFMQELAQAEQELRLTPETTIAIAHKHQVCVVGANFQ
ncbi:hypothetical protein C7B82_09635 [Stenomitos frigidus ULC18]|uniref:Cupin type-2 domain-containing protein n=2 Tax=Stenomitos TaxID=1844270 RepID=A0A2T1EBD7_9CYAN|nr:hypothetical protein C7B82_09635 [Stenomitos frigidus ULC18]